MTGSKPGDASAQTGDAPFGARLRRLRESAGMTQEELAARSGLTAKGISALERGERRRPYPHTVRSLADALGLAEEERAALISAVPKRGAEKVIPPPEADPAAPSADSTVPVPSTPLLGREKEVEEVTAFLSRPGTRLVTLTGAGGVGKTRLALAVAAGLEGSFPDGVAFVALAPVGDPSLVPAAIARAFQEGEAEDRSQEDDPRALLRERELLLVLDNFEHVAQAALELAALIETCEGLTVLVTSRAPLRVRGEQEYPVEPLGLPFSTLSADPETVLGSPSGRLFVERARAASPAFEVTKDNAPAVAAICWRLAGLPLALELAAAKARFLDPPSLLQRLDRALSGGWARDLPERQRTMRSALDWSYDLLSEREKTLFRRLAVFAGACSLEAAEEIGGEDAGDVMEVLGGLVEQSLVTTVQGQDGVSRYGMLAPIRQYAREKLEETGEAEATRRRHACFFLQMAERAYPELFGPRQVWWFGVLDLENDDLRAAIGWALSADEAEIAARLGWALWPFWRIHGHQHEGRRWMEATLRRDLPPYWRGRAVNVARAMAYAQGDYEVSERHARECLDIALETNDEALEGFGWVGLGLAALGREDFEAAAACMEKAYPLFDRSGERGMAPMARVWLGTAQLAAGDQARALSTFEEGASLARRTGERVGIYIALYNMAQVSLARGDHDGAATLLEEGVALSEEMGDAANLAYFLQGLSVVAGVRAEWRRMARLSGASESLLESAKASVYNYYLPSRFHSGDVAVSARSVLGEAAFEEARAQGRAMTFPAAVAYALGGETAVASEA